MSSTSPVNRGHPAIPVKDPGQGHKIHGNTAYNKLLRSGRQTLG